MPDFKQESQLLLGWADWTCKDISVVFSLNCLLRVCNAGVSVV